MPAAFPGGVDGGAGGGGDVLDGQRGQFGEAQSCLDCGEEEGVVSAPVPGRAVWHGQEGVGLGSGQVGHDCPVVSALWDRQDLARGMGAVGDEWQCVAVEGVDRGQARVAGGGAVVTFVVEVVEESADGDGVEVVDREAGGVFFAFCVAKSSSSLIVSR